MASAMLRSWSMTFMMICIVVVMMREPPGLPVMIKGLPSFITMVGLIELSGRLLPSPELASPPTRP